MGAKIYSEDISDQINAHFKGRTGLTLLEGGCGSSSHFDMHGIVKSVGIDISKDQLDRNAVLSEKILGDLQTYPLGKEKFDIVICWDVVEHLPDPQAAILNMVGSLKKDGLLVLGFPHMVSFKGLV